MPELPDIITYLKALEPRVLGRRLEGVRLLSPFVLRTVTPPLSAVQNKKVVGLRRIGKRIVLALEDDLFVVIHLMIAGRLRWKEGSGSKPAPNSLARFDFENGSLFFTEASTKKRAAIHVILGEESLRAIDPAGLEVLETDLETFARTLRQENHTLKRSLTDPRLFSGIGNAYSDEILHRGRLSPVRLTSRLDDEEIERLFQAVRTVLLEWIERLERETGAGFPEKVTAFREGMAVHGRYGQPCPDCGAPVQRISYAENECNYCAPCQTGGKLLADRGLSRLLKQDWPRSLAAMEEMRRR